jgi:hypothetical protein
LLGAGGLDPFLYRGGVGTAALDRFDLAASAFGGDRDDPRGLRGTPWGVA